MKKTKFKSFDWTIKNIGNIQELCETRNSNLNSKRIISIS